MQSELQIPGPSRRHPIRRHVRRAAAIQQKAHDDSDVKLFPLPDRTVVRLEKRLAA